MEGASRGQDKIYHHKIEGAALVWWSERQVSRVSKGKKSSLLGGNLGKS